MKHYSNHNSDIESVTDTQKFKEYQAQYERDQLELQNATQYSEMQHTGSVKVKQFMPSINK